MGRPLSRRMTGNRFGISDRPGSTSPWSGCARPHFPWRGRSQLTPPRNRTLRARTDARSLGAVFASPDDRARVALRRHRLAQIDVPSLVALNRLDANICATITPYNAGVSDSTQYRQHDNHAGKKADSDPIFGPPILDVWDGRKGSPRVVRSGVARGSVRDVSDASLRRQGLQGGVG